MQNHLISPSHDGRLIFHRYIYNDLFIGLLIDTIINTIIGTNDAKSKCYWYDLRSSDVVYSEISNSSWLELLGRNSQR